MTAISNTRYDHLRRDFAWRSMDFEVRQCAVIDELTEIDGTEHYGVYLQDHMHDVICAPMRANSSALLISDITSLGGNQYRFNFTGALDGSVVVGDFLHVKGATNEGNNGRYEIVSKGTAYVVVVNANGAAQASGGTVLCAISYSPMIETQSAPSAGQYSPDYTSGSGIVRLNASRDTEYFVLQYEGGGSIDRIGVGGKGSGGGGGGTGINLLDNGDGETDTAGWITYADAAGVEPVDGTGGSPSISWTLTSTAPLRGNGAFLLTKDAANRQGQGVSIDVLIDNADRGQILELRGEGKLVSGSYDSDLRIFAIDVDNSVVIELTARDLESGSTDVPFTFRKTIQVPFTATTLRLCFHIASTSTSAFSMQFDTLEFGPVVRAYGSPITDMEEYGPLTIGAVTTPPSKGTVVLERAMWCRMGSYAFISYEYVQSSSGSGGSGAYKYPMPPGLKIDHSRASFRGDDGITFRGILGHGWLTGDGSTGSGAKVRAFDADNLSLFTEEGFFAENGDTIHSFSNSSLRIHFTAMVPIAGWKSNVEVSADADTRVWAARATGTPANAADGNPVIFPTVSFDTHGAYDETTGEYTAPANGYIEASGYFSLSGTSPLFAVYVDGVQGEDCGNTTVTGNCVIATGPVKVKAGQKITIRPHGAAANGFVAGGYVSFRRCSGASQIAASESVFASGYVSSNYAVNANEAVNFDTVIEDSHNCITPGAADAWEYVFPLSGSYLISLIGAVTGTDSVPELELDGSAVCSLVTLKQSGSPVGSGSALIRAKQGQILQINSSASTTFVGSGAPYQSMISISRVGN